MASPAVSPLRSKKLVEPNTSVNSTVMAFLCLRSCSSISARAFSSSSTSAAVGIDRGLSKCPGGERGSQWHRGNKLVVRMYFVALSDKRPINSKLLILKGMREMENCDVVPEVLRRGRNRGSHVSLISPVGL